MKKIILNIALLLVTTLSFAQIGIGTTSPNASAALDVSSTTKGMLLPRMTTAQRTAISSPAEGLQVYDTTTNTNWYHNGTSWTEVTGVAPKFVDGTTAANAVFTGGNVGIGTTSPNHLIDLGATAGKKLAIYQNPAGSNFYGFGLNAGGLLELHAGSAPAGNPKMTVRHNGFIGVGVNTPLNLLHMGAPGGIQLTDSEIINSNVNNGTFFFDNDFSGAGEAGNGHFTTGGGGISLYQSSHSAWGGLVDTNNMPFLNMDVNSLHIGGTSNPGDNNLIVDGKIGVGVVPTNSLDVAGSISTDAYFKINSWGGYGTGNANMWYDGPGGVGSSVGLLSINANGNHQLNIQNDGKVAIGTANFGNGKFTVAGIVEYANNAAALAAGLVVGSFYRTGDLLKIVH